jgi:dTDP-4-dehydrorhamnose 3,5-epimerase
MKTTLTSIPGLLLLDPKVFGDARGFFLESYNEKVMADLGIRERFVQDNQSFSTRNVLRGLHYQLCHPQGKLVRVVTGGSSTSRWICDGVCRTLESGTALPYLERTS